MTKQRFTPAYPAELRERGVRLFREHRGDYASDTAAYKAIAPKLGCSPDSLRVWCQQAERDAGQRGGLTSAEKDRIKELALDRPEPDQRGRDIDPAISRKGATSEVRRGERQRPCKGRKRDEARQ